MNSDRISPMPIINAIKSGKRSDPLFSKRGSGSKSLFCSKPKPSNYASIKENRNKTHDRGWAGVWPQTPCPWKKTESDCSYRERVSNGRYPYNADANARCIGRKISLPWPLSFSRVITDIKTLKRNRINLC